MAGKGGLICSAFPCLLLSLICFGAVIAVGGQLLDFWATYSPLLALGLLPTASIWVIMLGAISVFTTIAMMTGIYKENIGITSMGSVLMAGSFVLQLFAGAMLYELLANNLTTALEGAMTINFPNDNDTDIQTFFAWDQFQFKYHCCGVNGPDDWSTMADMTVPQSCPDKVVNETIRGCGGVMEAIVRDDVLRAARITLITAIVQLTACLVGVHCIYSLLRRQGHIVVQRSFLASMRSSSRVPTDNTPYMPYSPFEDNRKALY